jgi:hypothetical protein
MRPSLSRVNESIAVARNRGGDTAFLLHAVFGLDRYPNYLDKWRAEELERLKGLLKNTVRAVEEAETRARARDTRLAAFPARSPTPETPLGAFIPARSPTPEAPPLEALLDPSLLAALSAPPSTRAGRLLRLVKEEAPNVFSFPILRPEAVDLLLSEVGRFTAWEEDRATPSPSSSSTSSFWRRNVPLRSFGWASAEDSLRHILASVGPVLFPDALPFKGQTTSGLDWGYGYVLGYAPGGGGSAAGVGAGAEAGLGAEAGSGAEAGAGPRDAAADGAPPDPLRHLLARPSLTPHTDDSELTLNVGLGRSFEGGELIFRGLRGTPSEGQEELRLKPVPGRAVVHLGQHLHEVSPVTGGERFALIVWARSQAYRAKTCPCCLIQRREGCVFDGTWK